MSSSKIEKCGCEEQSEETKQIMGFNYVQDEMGGEEWGWG